MTIYAVIDAGGAIINRVVIDPSSEWTAPPECHAVEDADDRFHIGGTYIDGVYTPPPAPPIEIEVVVPASISDRQFFQQLAIDDVISQAEALASNAAVIPAPLLAIIDAMPEEQQFAAKMLVGGATVFQRSHPMTIAIGAAYGWTSAQIDDFFRAAAAL